MDVAAWLSKTLAISWLFPLRTLATQNLLETHIPTSHSQKKNLVTCHFESVSGALPKKGDERARKSLCTRRGNKCLCISELPNSATKSYLVSARSTPGILLPVKQEDIPQVQCCSMFPGCLLVLKLKCLQGKAKTLRYLQRSCLLPRGLLGVRLQKPQPMAMLFQSDGAGKGNAGKEKPIVQENYSSPDQSSI